MSAVYFKLKLLQFFDTRKLLFSTLNFFLRPIEVPCIHHQIKFTAAVPAKPEPFFRSEFDVISPKIRSCDGKSVAAQVVYSNYRGPEKFVSYYYLN